MSELLLDAALACIKAGVSIIPIDHTTKRPASRLLPKGRDGKATWKPFQDAIANEATVQSWFAAGIKSFAVVTGEVSGRLLVLDFDVPEFLPRWSDAVGNLANGLPVQKTGGGGYQLFLRCSDPGGNDKLAWTPDEQAQTGRTIAIETRAEGGYAVVAPSLHPSGQFYEWLGTLTAADAPLVTQQHAQTLLAAARALDKAPKTRQERERAETQALNTHKRSAHLNGQASVIDAFNAANPIESLLARYGYVKGRHGRFIRPGGNSESVSVKDGRSCHWSSNDPLNDGRGNGGCGCHDAFGTYNYYEHGGDAKAAVKAAAATLGMSSLTDGLVDRPSEPWPDPLSLPPGLPPVMPFDFNLLPESLHAWVKDISDRMQCPPDYCAATAMIMAGALIGRKVAIRPKRHDDWQVVPNLYGAMVGRPSQLKSPAMREVLKYPAKLEVDAKEEFTKLNSEHESKALVAEVTKNLRKASLKKALKDGGDVDAITAEIIKECEDQPTRQRYLTNDTTVEKLGVILAENPNGILLFLDELISLLRSMEREGHEGDRGFYLTSWAGDSRYTYDRIGRGTLDIEAAIVSIVGSIQPGVIAEYLRGAIQGGNGDDGLIQRFQMTVWPDPAATWTNVDRYPDARAKEVAYAALRRLTTLAPGVLNTEHDTIDAAALPFLRFDESAQEIFDAWRHDLETRLLSASDHPAIESHLAKYRSLIPSLALILHLLEGGVCRVTTRSLEKAIGWGKYLESHARRLYAGVTEAPAVAARLLANRIQNGDLPNDFAARDVYRHGWSGLDKDRTESVIDVLLSLRWLEERTEPTGGRNRTRYVVNPKIRIRPQNELTKLPKDPSVSSGSASGGTIGEIDDRNDDRRRGAA